MYKRNRYKKKENGMDSSYESRKKYYKEHMQDIISAEIALKCKDDIVLSYLVQISILLDHKFKRMSDAHKELFTEAVFSVFEYLKHKFPTIICRYEDFEKIVERNLKKIFFSKFPGFSKKTYASYKLKYIAINKKLKSSDYEELLCVFTHELIHCISNDINFTGFVKNTIKRRGILTNIIQDAIYDGGSYSRINEMQTEWIMLQVLDDNFDIKYKKYNFLLNNGEEVKLITKGVSYRHIVIYMDSLNFITENKLIEVYMFPNISIEDFLMKQFSDLYEEFQIYLNDLNIYSKSILNYDTKEELHNEKHFKKMLQSYEKLMEAYLAKHYFTDKQFDEFKRALTKNILIIENSGNIFEEFINKFDNVCNINQSK